MPDAPASMEPEMAPSKPPRLLTRRQGIVGALALVGATAGLAACSSSSSPDGQSTAPTAAALPPQDPTLIDEQALIDRYDAAISAFPALAGDLTPLRDQHLDHLTALGGSPAASPSSQASSVAPSPKAAIGSLIDAERAGMRQRLAACVDAKTPEQARVLAFIAASEGSHIPALQQVKP